MLPLLLLLIESSAAAGQLVASCAAAAHARQGWCRSFYTMQRCIHVGKNTSCVLGVAACWRVCRGQKGGDKDVAACGCGALATTPMSSVAWRPCLVAPPRRAPATVAASVRFVSQLFKGAACSGPAILGAPGTRVTVTMLASVTHLLCKSEAGGRQLSGAIAAALVWGLG